MAPVPEELSDLQTNINNSIARGDVNEFKTLLSEYKGNINYVDSHGMTPLLHAAYKGNKQIVQILLDQGADVNSGQHEHAYTALHFAALSGNSEICEILLAAGAKSHQTNSIGRTASQMAAFVGNHACVAVINNFVPKSDIEYYTVAQGQDKEPKLPSYLSSSLHKFVMQINLNPVRVALNLQKCSHLIQNLDKVKKVLELLRDREMTRGQETNEIMSFKYHYLSFIVSEVARCKKLQELQQEKKKEQNDKTEEDKKLSDPVELFIKKMLKVNKGDIPEYQESFLRECVREFPNRECTLFRQMVTTLASENSPTAVSVISAAINGQRGFTDDIITCNTCGEEKPAKKCSKCKAVQYCDRECQRLHWFMHKKACNRLSTSVETKQVQTQLESLEVS